MPLLRPFGALMGTVAGSPTGPGWLYVGAASGFEMLLPFSGPNYLLPAAPCWPGCGWLVSVYHV